MENSRNDALKRSDSRAYSTERPRVPTKSDNTLADEIAVSLISELRELTGANKTEAIVGRDNLEELLESNLFSAHKSTLEDNALVNQQPLVRVGILKATEQPCIIHYKLVGIELYDPANRTREKTTSKRLKDLCYQDAYEVSPYYPIRSLKWQDIVSFAYHCVKQDLLAALIIALIITLLMLASPIITNRVVQDVVPSGDLQYIASATIISLLIALYRSLFSWLQGFFLTRLSQKLSYSSSIALYNRILQLPVEFSQKYSVGDLTSRAGAFNSLLDSFSSTTLSGIVSSISLVGYIVLMFFYDTTLAIFACATVAVITIIQFSLSLKLIRFRARSEQLNADLYDATVQTLSLAAEVRTTATEPFFLDKWSSKKNFATTNSFEAETFQDWMSTLTDSLNTIGYVLFYSVIIYRLYTTDSINILSQTTGTFIVFTSAFNGFAAQADILSSLLSDTISDVIVDFGRAKKLLTQEPESGLNSSKARIQASSDIRFKGVSFYYGGERQSVFRDLDFTIKSGKFNVIFGPSGCGKSTILSMILGFYKPTEGNILIGSASIDDIDLKNFRSQIGTVLQTPTLPPGTISDAVSAGIKLPEEKIWDALKAANIEEEIVNLPMQLNTVLSESASNISGGQRQRLCIARALVNDPKLLLEDEATSALDTLSQRIIADNLKANSITRVVVAHRLSAIRNCDHMIVINKGCVESEGSFEHCLENSKYLQSVINNVNDQ